MKKNMIGKYRSKLNDIRAKRVLLHQQVLNTKCVLEAKRMRLSYSEEALIVAQTAATETQKSLEFHISSLVSTALSSVFSDPYSFVVEFVNRRGTMECDMFFEREGRRMSPLDSSGYGAVDIASLALLVTFLSMNDKASPVLILDEPTRNLSLNLHGRASEMIKQLSDKLGIQFIIVSHSESLCQSADKVFKVAKKRGKSHITLEEEV